MPESSNPIDLRNRLLEQFQVFANEIGAGKARQPREIAARPRKAGDEPARDRIDRTSKNNRYGRGSLLGSQSSARICGHNDIDLECHHLGRESGEPLELTLRRSEFDHYVATLNVTEVAKSLAERLWEVRARGQIGRHVRYSSDIASLLSACAPRAHYGRAKESHELPSLHSITSSARASSEGGTVSPIAFAAFTLISNSNFVA